MIVLALLVAAASAAPNPAIPEVGYADPQYQACIADVRAHPEAARARAQGWIAAGGGAEADYCLALSDLASGKSRLAGIRLSDLGERADAGDALIRARLFSQSALAFLDAGDLENAQGAIAKAFALAPDSPELDLVAAKIDVAYGKNEAAIKAVTHAEKLGVVSVEGYIARARALIALQKPQEAADDVVAALSISSLNIDALTLRGDLARLGVNIEVDTAQNEAPTGSASSSAQPKPRQRQKRK